MAARPRAHAGLRAPIRVVTLLWLGSLSDYLGRRRVIAAGPAAAAAGCGWFLIAHAVETLFAARAFQGLAVGLISGAAGAALVDLRPNGGAAPVVSSAAPTGGQALGALGGRGLGTHGCDAARPSADSSA